jgi:alkylation response protein AidB-like acyl-CoA dehydrogenase
MDFKFTSAQEELRREVADFFSEVDSRQIWREYLRDKAYFPHDLWQKVAQKKWLGLGFPHQYGGRDATVMDRLVLLDEFCYADLPPIFAVVFNAQFHMSTVILEHGSEELKNKFLPKIINGEIKVSMGFSEPDAGSDAVNISTAAVEDKDGFIVSGTKIWNFSHCCDYMLTSTLTDRNAPKHKGISVFLIDLKSPGVSVEPIWMLGERRNEVVLDEVRVPAQNMIGTKNQGWLAVGASLGAGRYYSGEVGSAQHLLEQIILLTKNKYDGELLSQDCRIRSMVAQAAAELEVARILYYRAGWMVDHGLNPSMEGEKIKIISSELKVRLSSIALDVLGQYGQLEWTSKAEDRVPLEGKIVEHFNALRPITLIGGSPPEIHKNILANRALGLRFK